MSELRKDYILDQWVMINEKRGKRPNQLKIDSSKDDKIKGKICFFCPGNEHMTPPEIGRVEEKGYWIIRWFPNKFSLYSPDADPRIKNKGIMTYAGGCGYHEVIAETNDHNKQLWDLSIDHIKEILKVYTLRINELSKKKNVSYVSIFKNHGEKGGASLRHSHTQLATLQIPPPRVIDEIKASHNKKKCLYCSIVKKEKKSKRLVFENKNFIAIAPYASRFNYEVGIFSKKHFKSMHDFDDSQLSDLAHLMKRILSKLKILNCSYNYYFHYAPKGKDLHFHIEIIPRIEAWAGFEFASGIIVNTISPETAAAFYRKKVKSDS
ncbi:MAG: galactose-1-phosphate uridylyltransferase [Candidatus Woesearchaeota archaeon]